MGVARLGDDEAVTGLLLLGILAALDDGSAGDGAVDQQVRLSLRPGSVEVEYRVQLGRQAAFAEVLEIDADRDGRLSPDELARYFASLEKRILGGLELRLDGLGVPLRRVGELKLEMPFRKIYRFEASCPTAGRLDFHNENFPDSPGTASLIVEPPQELDLLVDGDPGTLERDLVGELRPGTGVVERRRGADRPAAPSTAAAASLRFLALAGLLGGVGLSLGRRRGAALLCWTAASTCGASAIVATRPSTPEAERIFRPLHEDWARSADASLRRLKPLETHIAASVTAWSPEFEVRHRWAAYGSVPHSGHQHAGVTEREGRFRVRWDGAAWRLEELDRRTPSEPLSPIASGPR
jgi:hypothetical protein